MVKLTKFEYEKLIRRAEKASILERMAEEEDRYISVSIIKSVLGVKNERKGEKE